MAVRSIFTNAYVISEAFSVSTKFCLKQKPRERRYLYVALWMDVAGVLRPH
jgi:hypothetical protein